MSRFVVGLFFICGFLYAKPMESIERYNIILVHGAADSLSGVDCEASDLKAPFEYYTSSTSDFGRIDGYLKEGLLDDSRSTATGMIKTLPDWINDKILDGERKDRFGIYLNRPFVNPANTPVVNGGEIGKRTWKGRDNCKTRRSLTEEAEEMRNYGREFLVERRNDDSLSYRKYRSDVGYFTHRNILIAHSMGGLASREYVQGDGYNGDVDKVITLDSPHRGTYSLDGLLYMKHYASVKSAEVVAQMSFLSGLVWVLGKNDVTMNQTALTAVATGLVGLDVLNGVVDAVVDLALGYGFTDDDPLADYIYPESNDLKKLNGKGWNETSSMYRVLYGVGGLTFGSTEEYLQKYFSILIPDGLFAMVKNIVAQISHTEIDNPAYWNNILAGGTLGLLGGLSLTDQGSILIPHWSGAGENVSIFEDAQTDVVKVPFVANEHVDNYNTVATVIGINATAIASLYASEALNAFSPAAVAAAKTGIAVSAGAALAAFIGPATVEAIKDMTENHKNPSQDYWHEKQKSKKNSYTKISGDSESVESYLLEDFLYEKPFVNLSVRNDNDWTESVDSTKMDSLGLYGKNGSLAVMSMKTTRGKSLKFAGQTDWGKLGVKTERWERVDGLDTNNNLKEKSVPIRHVERYEVPAITVEDYIEKYSFVVDDLMPHRLRQIRMNFNYQEEIAWECDIEKDPASDDACIVYKRQGDRWDTLRFEKHPVNKNGRFDFVPSVYGYSNPDALQKDNQNTVTISTVNKIGLKNSQRFYYLFKATANKLDPIWPYRDIVLNKVKGFKAEASALGYQDFRVVGARDRIIAESNLIASSSWLDMEMSVDSFYHAGNLEIDSSSASFSSAQFNSAPVEGEYRWNFVANICNMADSANGCFENTYDVPFRVDSTAPIFTLRAERKSVNPVGSSFAARFIWDDTTSLPDIRAMRVSLGRMDGNSENRCGTFLAEFQPLTEIGSPYFAIRWNDSVQNTIMQNGDGYYCVKALAIDYAVPDSAVYAKMNRLVDAIATQPGNVPDSLWPIATDSLNTTIIFDSFFVDTRAPTMLGVNIATDSSNGLPYALPLRPSMDTAFDYSTYSQLLTIGYGIYEPLAGRISTPVAVVWNFVHLGDTTKVDRAGDSVWIAETDTATASWTETAGMRLEDGDYEIRAKVRDAADNESLYLHRRKLRVDKTSPHIAGLVSNHLVYSDAEDLSATIIVDEKNDAVSNRSGMYCYYRVSGSGMATAWRRVSENLLNTDTLTFSLDSIGQMHGKCYLEAACIDAAGNASIKTDIFFIGERTPVISSPRDSAAYTELVAITGVAPPVRIADSSNTVYRLRYAKADSLGPDGKLIWETANIFVVSALRDSSFRNVSRISQSSDAVLGYLDRRTENGGILEGSYIIELGTCSGANCFNDIDSLWKTDSSTVFLGECQDSLWGDSLEWRLVKDRSTMVVGKDSLVLSLNPSGLFDGSYFLRIYAEDKEHTGMFDVSASKVWRNPYHGIPDDTSMGNAAVWFYEQDGKYHLKWKGLLPGDSLQVSYDSAGFGQACVAPESPSNTEQCHVRVLGLSTVALPPLVNSYLEDYPEWIPPSGISHEMLLFGETGHVVMTASRAFRVSRKNSFADMASSQMRVYFGKSTVDGFYWVGNGLLTGGTLDPLTMGWTVNPQAYGLSFVWNGLLESGMYPAEGAMKVYAEVTENVVSSPRVFLASEEVEIRLPELEIALADRLPDAPLLERDSTVKCNDDSTDCDSTLFRIGSMAIKYGIKYRDAQVGIYVMDGTDTIAVLQDPATTIRANSNDSAYQILWNGKGKKGLVAGEKLYTLRIVAKPAGADSLQHKDAAFRVRYGSKFDMTPENPKDSTNMSPTIYVVEAFPDTVYPNIFRYEPIADYIVDAEILGWHLPDSSLIDGIPLVGNVSGKQAIIGYEPERFSLAVKRHRKELKLVVIAHFHAKLDEITGTTVGPISTCSEEYHHNVDDFDIYELTFSDNKRDTVVNIWKHYEGKGFNGEGGPPNGFMEVIVLTKAKFDSYQISRVVSQAQFDEMKVASIWNLENFLGENVSVFHIPGNESDSISFGVLSNGTCDPKYGLDDSLKDPCEYSRTDTTDGYNANKNLLKLTFAPISESRFYTNKGLPNPSCAGYPRYQIAFFNMHFLIPESYWDAPFGMDNLVNRTIRFDHTNKTLFNKEAKGYWASLDSLQEAGNGQFVGIGSYHDGSDWRFDRTYGLLTPFETQRLSYFPASRFPGGSNTFLFADENSHNPQASRFDLHFYGDANQDNHFVVKVLGTLDSGELSSACDFDTLTNVLIGMGKDGLCQIQHTSLIDSVLETPYFDADSDVEFYVGRNTKWSFVTRRDSIDYPAERDWNASSANSACKVSGQTWDFVEDGSAACYKFYDFGSRVHHYYNDYSDSSWKAGIAGEGQFIRNMTNSPYHVHRNPQDSLFSRFADAHGSTSNKVAFYAIPVPDNYDRERRRFYVPLDSSINLISDLVKDHAGVEIGSLRVDSSRMNINSSSISFSANRDSLYIKADSVIDTIIYRKTEDPDGKALVRPKIDTLSMRRLYPHSDWTKDAVIQSASLKHLDGSKHTHLRLRDNKLDSSGVLVEFIPIDSVRAKRPKEFVELKAFLQNGHEYQIGYLNGDAFYAVPASMLDSAWRDTIRTDSSGLYHLAWFDVNKLQGNTQFMLLWGEGGTAYSFAKFDMIIGRAVKTEGTSIVKSLFEEAEVIFPPNALSADTAVTVRIADAKDYPFEVFNKLALKGPIVEVLPSKVFADSALPRIQVKIGRDDMIAMHATPQTVRLYKIDFEGKRFVPLENALYGFLNADGGRVMDGRLPITCTEENRNDERCSGNGFEWAYLQISAETRTFSVFMAMDSAFAETPNFRVTLLPEIATTSSRDARVDGISRYNIYVDDDSLWADRDDTTPPIQVSFIADSNGFVQLNLPSRGGAIDTNYVFVVALGEPDADGNAEELPAAPAEARALTVNTQFACSVPSDSLWLGLDNGYMAYGANCTHPGHGLVTLVKDGRVAVEIRVEIPDTVIYDGSKNSGFGKIAPGVYESRYVGVSALGEDIQIAGPSVHTDSVRPAIASFAVQETSDILDRIFTVNAKITDSESGIARVSVMPVYGQDTMSLIDILPDSAGNVNASIRLSRRQLAGCVGCILSISMRAEDYGHNHSESRYVSEERLYPYPAELVLWYPAREGGGDTAHEYLGTGHDLSLSDMSSPWRSDVGLYFGHGLDYAVGTNGPVDFGSSTSYSFEARIKRGHAGSGWRDILGFGGIGGLEIRLLQNGRSLRLVEGNHVWETDSILPFFEKTWTHVIVTVDSANVKFYVNGELKSVTESGIAQERELEGAFSVGRIYEAPSYLGNLSDIRMYSRALTATEVEALSRPTTDVGEVSEIVVATVNDMDATAGFMGEFSCSVAGNRFLVSVDSATATVPVYVQKSADYRVVLYVRSPSVKDVGFSIGESDMHVGNATISNTWRAVTLSGVSLHLAPGTHSLTLKAPPGIHIGGVAFTTEDVPASTIAWGESSSTGLIGISAADTVRKIKSYLRYEGYPETSTLRPRIRLRNVSNEPVDGFSVRYYFRGEDASQTGVDRYWPNNVATFPAVHSESANMGYVEWMFTETIPVAGTVFGGDGPHFGLYNADYTPWDASDDPSFVAPTSGLVANTDGFYEDAGIVVLDKDNNLIGGSCAEMEDPVSLETKVRVLASDMRGDNQASEIHFKVENTGNVSLKNFDVRYYFFVEEGLAPDYEINDKSKCSSASMENLGSGRWLMTIHCDASLAAGKTWQNPVKVTLHLPGWAAMWNADDDPSHDSLGMAMREARGICVFDSTGLMIYGSIPVWTLPAPDEVDPDSVYNVDFGYHAPGNSIPVIRTSEGLVIMMDSWTYVELSLVTALGTPVKSIFSGSLAPGEQFVHVDWTGIDMSKTYLMLKVNGSIKSTKKLSLL